MDRSRGVILEYSLERGVIVLRRPAIDPRAATTVMTARSITVSKESAGILRSRDVESAEIPRLDPAKSRTAPLDAVIPSVAKPYVKSIPTAASLHGMGPVERRLFRVTIPNVMADR